MKKVIYLLYTQAFCLLICLLLCNACINDDWTGSENTPSGNLVLTLRVPGIAAAGAPATRAIAAADESEINNGQLHLLLFIETDGKYVFHRYAQANGLVRDNANQQRYTMNVPIVEGEHNEKFRLMAIANLTEERLKQIGGGDKYPAFTDCNNQDNPMESVRLLINYANPEPTDDTGRWPVAAGTFVRFPMWGESEPFVARPGGDVGVVNMTRAVARIDVGINFERNPDNSYPIDNMRSSGLWNGGKGTYFKLMSVSLYHVPVSGIIAPTAANWDAATRRATAATARGDVAALPRKYTEADFTTDAPPGDEADNKRALTRTLYVPEAENKGRNREQAVCLVVGGVYGKNSPTTYYRIDIYNRTRDANGNLLKPTPETRLDILRNHAYIVNITSVSGAGAPTEDEALKADNTNMELEIVEWNQDNNLGDITTDGVYYINLSQTEQEFFSDGSPVNFSIDTNYEGELGSGWQMEADEVAKQHVLFYDATGQEIAYGSPNWPAIGRKGLTELRVGMKEFAQPGGTTDIQAREALLNFTAGRMKVRLRLRQISREVLNIRLSPEEMNFSKAPLRSQPIGIQVTTRKPYVLRASWKDANGTPCTWVLNNPAMNTTPFPDDRFEVADFFAQTGEGRYSLKPKATTASRVFTFTFTATVAGSTPATNVLNVYQKDQDIDWYVDGGTGIYKNEVTAEYNATSIDAPIVTTPANLTWYFSKGAGMEAAPWITNLDAMIGAMQTTGGRKTFQLQKNESLGRRTYTLQARSTDAGFDENNSQLVLVQKGLPLVLTPQVSGNAALITSNKESDGRVVYTRNYGTALNSTTEQLDITANTDWYWYWDKSSPTFARDLRQMFGTSFGHNTVAENKPTTDGPSDGLTQKTWANSFTSATPNLTLIDETQLWGDRTNVPLGGERTLTMELRNKNPKVDIADKEAYKKLLFKRSMPAYTTIMHWPFAEGENLDTHSDAIAAGGETPFRVRTNATGSIKYYSGASTSSLTLQGSAEVAAVNGYDEFTKTLKSLGCPVDAESWKYSKTHVRLAYTGLRRDPSKPNTNDISFTEERNYVYGFELNMPARNMEPKQRMLNSGAHDLIFDFSSSTYSQMKVRVSTYLVNTVYDSRGVTDKNVVYLNGENGEMLTNPETQIKVRLPENTNVNLLRKVVVEYYSQDPTNHTVEWKTDKSPVIYQDATPCDGGYIVKYTPYSQNVHAATYNTSEVGSRTDTQKDDLNICDWWPASKIMSPTLVKANECQRSIVAAQGNGTTICTTTYNTNVPATFRHADSFPISVGLNLCGQRGQTIIFYTWDHWHHPHQKVGSLGDFPDISFNIIATTTSVRDAGSYALHIDWNMRCDHCGNSANYYYKTPRGQPWAWADLPVAYFPTTSYSVKPPYTDLNGPTPAAVRLPVSLSVSPNLNQQQ